MEKLYKILKIVIVILAAAVLAAGIWRFSAPADTGEPTQTAAAAETEEAEASAAPDFTVYDIDGNPVKLSDFRGQPVILNFWASWCGPCKSEMPDFEEAWLEYGDTVTFLTVNLTDGYRETLESASGYIAQQGYTFPVYYDTDSEAAYAYNLTTIPRTYFIDAEGSLVYAVTQMLSAEVLQSGIDLLLDTD